MRLSGSALALVSLVDDADPLFIANLSKNSSVSSLDQPLAESASRRDQCRDTIQEKYHLLGLLTIRGKSVLDVVRWKREQWIKAAKSGESKSDTANLQFMWKVLNRDIQAYLDEGSHPATEKEDSVPVAARPTLLDQFMDVSSRKSIHSLISGDAEGEDEYTKSVASVHSSAASISSDVDSPKQFLLEAPQNQTQISSQLLSPNRNNSVAGTLHTSSALVDATARRNTIIGNYQQEETSFRPNSIIESPNFGSPSAESRKSVISAVSSRPPSQQSMRVIAESNNLVNAAEFDIGPMEQCDYTRILSVEKLLASRIKLQLNNLDLLKTQQQELLALFEQAKSLLVNMNRLSGYSLPHQGDSELLTGISNTINQILKEQTEIQESVAQIDLNLKMNAGMLEIIMHNFEDLYDEFDNVYVASFALESSQEIISAGQRMWYATVAGLLRVVGGLWWLVFTIWRAVFSLLGMGINAV